MQKSFHQTFSRCRKRLFTWRERHKPQPHRTATSYYQKVRLGSLTVIAVFLANFFLSLIPSTPAANAYSCDHIEFIFARGSGEAVATEEDPTGGPSYQQWKYWIEDVMYDSQLQTTFYDLGGKSYGGHQYPAVPVTETFGGVINLLGAALTAGEGFAFGDSVDEGVAELKAHIDEVGKKCPSTRFVLGGFSQGAMVISKSLSQLNPDKIIYAATFGDPKIYLPEGNSHKGLLSKIPDACKGLNFSNYRIYVPDCYAYEGALGSYRPYQPDGYWDKLGTWCNGKDIMCSSGWSISDHVDYVNQEYYRHAAKIIRDHINDIYYLPVGVTTPPTPTPPSSSHDVALLFDATGSMKDLIDVYKTQAKELISKIISAGGRAALFTYREIVGHSWPNMRCDFDCSEEEIGKSIDRIYAHGGGEEEEEGLLSAIKMALDESDWAEGATKSIVVLTDAGYHDPDLDGSTLESIVRRTLEIDPVNIYIVSTNTEEQYADLVRLTNGEYFDVNTEAELSVQRVFERPVAALNQFEFYGVVGDTFEFDASSSHSQYGENLTYEWDLTGNDEFVSLSNATKVTKTFTSTFDDFIQVRVSDSHGVSTMSARVKISPAPENPAQVTNLQVQTSDDVSQIVPDSSANALANNSFLMDLHPADHSQAISFNTDAAKVLVALEDAPMGFVIPEDNSGYFSVEDVTQPTRLTLIPYSAAGQRGEKVSVTLQPNAQPTPDQPDPQDPITPADPDDQKDPDDSDDQKTPEDKPTPDTSGDKHPATDANHQPDSIIAGASPTTEVLLPPLYVTPSDRPREDTVPTAPSAGTCW